MMLKDLAVQIYADGARYEDVVALADLCDADTGGALIRGFTTNPTLMARAGVKNYAAFARGVLDLVGGRPVSFEVLADDTAGVIRQAEIISSWGENAWVKVPIVNTQGQYNDAALLHLISRGIPVNVTAVFMARQLEDVLPTLIMGTSEAPRAARIIISVFAGRIADTGRPPGAAFSECAAVLENADLPDVDLLWASPRQIYDVVLAEQSGADIITLPPDLITKLHLLGRDLAEFSRDTVQMFDRDARASGIAL